MPARTGAYSPALGGWGSERRAVTAEKLSLKKWWRVWYLEQLTNGAAHPPRQAARQQLFQAEEVCLEGRREGTLPHPMCQLCMCLWRRLCVCVCLSVCVWKCVSVSVNSACLCVCVCLHTPISLFLCVAFGSLTEESGIQVPFGFFKPQERTLITPLGFFYLFFLPHPRYLLITSLFWCSARTSQWGYYPNKCFCEVCSNSNASSK